MKEQLEKIRQEALDALNAVSDSGELEALRVRFLGKKGELTAVLKTMGKLSAEERPVMAGHHRRGGLSQGAGAEARRRDHRRDCPRQDRRARAPAPDEHRARRGEGPVHLDGLQDP